VCFVCAVHLAYADCVPAPVMPVIVKLRQC
jgi:hypothetical protein